MIVAAVLLTLIGALAALRLEADRSPDSLVNRGSVTYAATQRFYDQFGGEPVEVLVKGDVRQLLLTDNLGRLLALESCLSGKAPGGQVVSGRPAPRPARRSRSSTRAPSSSVPRPSSTSSRSRRRTCSARSPRGRPRRRSRPAQQAAQRAKKRALGHRAAARPRPRPSSRSGPVRSADPETRGSVRADGLPRLDDPHFVSSVICDNRVERVRAEAPTRRDRSQLARRADLRPTAARISRTPNASEAISLFREAVADPTFRLLGGRASGPHRQLRGERRAGGLRRPRGGALRPRSSSCSQRRWPSW